MDHHPPLGTTHDPGTTPEMLMDLSTSLQVRRSIPWTWYICPCDWENQVCTAVRTLASCKHLLIEMGLQIYLIPENPALTPPTKAQHVPTSARYISRVLELQAWRSEFNPHQPCREPRSRGVEQMLPWGLLISQYNSIHELQVSVRDSASENKIHNLWKMIPEAFTFVCACIPTNQPGTPTHLTWKGNKKGKVSQTG